MKKYLTTIIMLISVLASYGQDKILFLGKNEFYPKLPNEKWYIYINTKEDEIELHESIAIPVDIIKYKTIYKFGNGATFVFLESNVQSISPNVTVEDFTKFKYGKCFIVGTGGMCYVWTKDLVLPISILDKDVHTEGLATLITVLYPPEGNSSKSSTSSSYDSTTNTVTLEKKLRKADDGFQWYEVKSGTGIYGAEDIFGNVIIPLNRYYTSIIYHPDTIYPHFGIKKGEFEGVCDSQGNEVISPKRGYRHICFMDNNNFGYFLVSKYEVFEGPVGVCDMKAREVIPCEYKNIIYNSYENVFMYETYDDKYIPLDIRLDDSTKGDFIIPGLD